MDELLVKYMLGEAKPEEITAVDEWLKTSDDNRRYFEQFKMIWKMGALLKNESRLDPDQSWQAFKQKVHVQAGETKPANPFVSRRWLSIAAMWLVLFGAIAIAYTLFRTKEVKMLVADSGNEVKIDTLADGSVITLNKHSVVTYPDRFTGDTREIKLNKGEAFFNIAHNKAKPFLIHVNDATVRVVGTSFNIKYGQDTTRVIVETGVVQVIRAKVKVSLKPKERADIDRSGNIKKSVNDDNFYNYYRTHKIVADKTPLWRVAEILSEAYGIKINVPDRRLAVRTLNTTLDLTSLDANLRVIAETFNVQAVRRGNQIIIQ